jgi:NAD(P)-dependent dehydrogenase (short-subunit alcohol dehydrogenase family)
MTDWSTAQLPDLSGVTVVVTGANSGLGLQTSLELARKGALVVLACRDEGRGQTALAEVRAQVPAAQVELGRLDLGDLSSVRSFAATTLADHPRIDVLVDNAGIMATPRLRTADGFEGQLGTNHLGHFALTGLLLPALLAAGRAGVEPLGGRSRVVTVSSSVHRRGSLHRDDLMLERGYQPWTAYAQSKLANLLFMRELAHRAAAAAVPLASLAAHPGYAATNLQTPLPPVAGAGPVAQMQHRLRVLASELGNRAMAQSASQGALPSLRAAADPLSRSGQYYGPSRLFESRGAPVAVGTARAALDDGDAA